MLFFIYIYYLCQHFNFSIVKTLIKKYIIKNVIQITYFNSFCKNVIIAIAVLQKLI